MEYFWAFLIFMGMFVATTFISAFLGIIIPICYSILGLIFGTDYLILGIGGLLASIANLVIASIYLRTEGAVSSGPRFTKIASAGYIVFFVLAVVAKYILNFDASSLTGWYLIPAGIFLGIFINGFHKKTSKQVMDNFYESVAQYKVVAKYEDDPRWALHLYFGNGNEGWSQTIPGSFCAKDPQNDLTFVFMTKKEALSYAQSSFKKAKCIDDNVY